jgi:hypothetical protein
MPILAYAMATNQGLRQRLSGYCGCSLEHQAFIAMEDCLKGVCLAGLPLLDQIHQLLSIIVNALGSKKVRFG